MSGDAEPRKGRKILRRVFRPSGAEFNTNSNPGLAPGATFLSRSAAIEHKISSHALQPASYLPYVTVIPKCSTKSAAYPVTGHHFFIQKTSVMTYYA